MEKNLKYFYYVGDNNLSVNQIKVLEINPSGMWEEQNDVR